MAARECKHDATARRARRGFFRAIRRHRSPTVATGRDTSQSAWQRHPCIDRSNRPVSSTDYRDALRRLPGLFIAGGSEEIQRNIVGERLLGLPGEPRVDKDLPFNQVRQQVLGR